jgi:hypothetical protein
VASATVLTLAVWNPWLDRHTRADALPTDVRAHVDDDASGLMPQDERFLDDKGADAAMLVVMDVRSADANSSHGDEHLPHPN